MLTDRVIIYVEGETEKTTRIIGESIFHNENHYHADIMARRYKFERVTVEMPDKQRYPAVFSKNGENLKHAFEEYLNDQGVIYPNL